MTNIEALILGIVQGVTEFLPVSSSGHLKLGQLLLGFKDLHDYLFFDLICHLGTLLALLWVLRTDIKALLTTNRKGLGLVALAILPLIPCYFLFNSTLKALYGLPEFLGFFFLLTAGFLFLGEKFAFQRPQVITTRRNALEAAFIGCAQAVALIPGISRSGSTMSAARILGWNREQAARFSFLLSIPTISGGIFLETLKVMKSETLSAQLPSITYFIGFAVSFVIGGVVLKWFLGILRTHTFKPFAWYCLLLGFFTLIYANFYL
jgi:undecaprenyl-diphosphatase